MATFPDLDRFIEDTTEDDTLTLPIGGREYTFRASLLPFGRALQIHKIRDEASRIMAARAAGATYQPAPGFTEDLKGLDERELYLEMLGDKMREKLIADKVPWPTVLHVGGTLLAWHMYGEAMARQVWTRGRVEEDDSRPPAEPSGSSSPPTTSRSGSTKKKRRKRKGKRSRGATTSSGGRS
ncbi:hypothetical protein [Amycolatopsis sp. BJA-103]|uniref:DUF7426 family protein n=1 Tax=Amycolatopsis sp. BJA-103 TaxID=1911175 RepID=UPI000C784901|nr:hypothetical protein [Amycolatopsis sp. BJA-103]AUI56776.1 hypothetical protein BKN51_00150 [Amycolatopsis sp. BJA-103]PNE13096.1 hypothetical protein B1H26_42385 [Amycolatopsis sp. BJA-103]